MIPKKSTSYHHGDLRRALLEAALELVAEVGAQGLSLREVARRAGVTHAAPYRHFSSKESLVATLAEDGFRLMLSYMAQSQEGAGEDPWQRFQAAGLSYLKFAVTHPSHFRLMFGANSVNREQYPSLLEASHSALAFAMEGIKACQRAGQIRAGSSLALGITAWSLVHGLASLWVENILQHLPFGDLETLGMTTSKILLEGLRERPGQPALEA